ncbi:MAG: trypsin-like serine protease [Phycisphaerae bacterium]|nr:trypsin-like serine protease [Phycisphaerae bacterium]
MRNYLYPWICGTLAFLAVICAFPAHSSAIVVCDDPADHQYDSMPGLEGVGYLSSAGGTTGVLISPVHILTAKHAVENISGHTFTLYTASGSETFGLVEKYVHPYKDLAVVRLDRSTGFSGYQVNSQTNELGSEIIIVGFGESGTGMPEPGEYPRGTGRYGGNRIDSTISGYLVFDFDEPVDRGENPSGGTTESMIAKGDSGGPSFVVEADALKIVGIHVGITNFDGDSIYPEYGDRGYDVRVSAYSEWIMQQIPEPGTLVIITVGGFTLMLRPRRKNHGAEKGRATFSR